jgi:hypothetical protein
MKLSLDRDGILKSFDIRGELKVTVTDPDYATARIQLSSTDTGLPIKFTVGFLLDSPLKSLGFSSYRQKCLERVFCPNERRQAFSCWT